MLQRASDDLDNIYNRIADDFKEIGTAEKMADALEDAILSLDEMPYRGSIRRTGAFANRGYRQIFVENFTISLNRAIAGLIHLFLWYVHTTGTGMLSNSVFIGINVPSCSSFTIVKSGR